MVFSGRVDQQYVPAPKRHPERSDGIPSVALLLRDDKKTKKSADAKNLIAFCQKIQKQRRFYVKHINRFFVLAALLVVFALAIFGGAGCSKMPNAPTADPTPVSKPDTVVVIINNPGGNTGGGDDGNTPNTPSAPVLPPVASFWKTDANGQEWTYFVTWFMRDEKVQKPEPWWLDPVPEWVLAHSGMNGIRQLGHKFEYAGKIELAPGSVWDCHRVKGHFVAFQVVSDYGQYANPDLAGNWIGDGQVDPTHPTLIPGAHVAPPDYWFTPVPWGSWL